MYLDAVNQDAKDWTSKYHAEHYIRQIQTLMIQMKRSQAELDAFTK